MNENRSINDTRQNLENILYGYYIKYSKMKELVDEAFVNCPPINSIDVYIDLYDMLKPIYTKNVYSNKSYIIVSSVINLAAHIRQYFRKYHNMWTRIFLVYANNSTCVNNTNSIILSSNEYSTIDYNNKQLFITSQLELVKILSAYINDVYYIYKTCMFPIFAYDNICKNKNIPAIIITKNKYAYQIPAYVQNTAVFRPKKHYSEDVSFAVYDKNILFKYYSKIKSEKTLEYLKSINPQYLGLLMSLTGNSQFSNLNCIVTSTLAIRLLYEAILYGRLLNERTADTDYIYSVIPDLSRYTTSMHLKFRYNGCDIIYQNMLYNQLPESLDYSWLINLNDAATVQDINNRYFINNPLDLNSL